MDKTPDVLYSEREKRINDAIQLKVPDRVPFFPLTPVIAAKYAGISMKEAFYDPAIWYNANKQMNIELQPDIIFPAQSFFSGQVYDAVDCKQLMWPGHGIPDDTHHQYVEQEYMKQDEYATLLEDPSDFTLRTYLPRVFGTLTAFNMLPPLQLFLFGYVSVSLMPLFNLPGFASAIESLRKASVEAAKWANANTSYLEEMKNLGFPCSHIAQTLAPFDLISDVLRGMRGSLTDMFRQPDKLLAAVEKLYPTVLWLALFVAKMRGNPRVYIPLHRGADGFMSEEQFETFYWPTLKRLILDIIKDGLTPVVFWEGTYDSRLKYLGELPKGKVLGIFDRSDIFKVKDVLGDTLCIAGNMQPSLLEVGSTDQVKEYTKKLIDIVGKGGGFIMSCSIIMEANPQLLRVWSDFTREYGRYY